MTLLRSNLLQASCCLALTVGLTACGETTEPEASDAVLSSVSGSGQSADAGTALANPLVVQVTRDGAAVSGQSVSWAVTAGGGSVSPTSSTTGGDGRASTTWTLGATAGANTVEATASGATGSPVTFQATGNEVAAPMAAEVAVQDNRFVASSQRVAVGGTVTWTWGGTNNHNVTFQPALATGESISATQSAGTFARDFPTAGTFPYLCTIHGSSMSGTIVVE